MLEHKRPTALSKYREEGARAVYVLHHSLLPSPSTQTTTLFKITPEETQTVWPMLERHKSLYEYVLDKLLKWTGPPQRCKSMVLMELL